MVALSILGNSENAKKKLTNNQAFRVDLFI